MGKKNQVSGPHFLSDEIQKISFSQSSFMKNMRFRKDTASAKSLNPIFSVMKSKTQRKCVFFTEQFHKKYEIPEGHCQCQVSEPHFLCDEVLKNTKKTFFLTEQFQEKYEILGGHCQCQVSEPHYLCTVAAEHIQLFFYKQIFIKIMRFEDLALAVSTSAKSLNLIFLTSDLVLDAHAVTDKTMIWASNSNQLRHPPQGSLSQWTCRWPIAWLCHRPAWHLVTDGWQP